ncbi:OsmC family protein [uncultured Odoribacter sp.]|uniref:OsmC family protein n=1 Tax=uncultured Odoribacter sp. TaxID=876416 RepID=UPI00345DE9E7
MMTTVKATYLGDLRIECEHLQSGTKIITDAPTDNHGKGESFSPTDLCASALAACMMTIMGLYAQNAGLDVKGTEIEITKVMATDPRRIGEVIVTFHMPDRTYTEKDKKALERAALTCPVHYSLGEQVKQTITFEW